MNTLFNLSEAATIALHSLAIIGNSEERLNVNRLAEKTKFSKNHLAKIVNLLVKYNYLSSERGPNGGFVISPKTRQATLFEILELIDGRIEAFQCTITCQNCYFESCLFGDHPKRFTIDFVEYLKNKTIADFTLKATE
jgi:Rrf2 family protein